MYQRVHSPTEQDVLDVVELIVNPTDEAFIHLKDEDEMYEVKKTLTYYFKGRRTAREQASFNLKHKHIPLRFTTTINEGAIFGVLDHVRVKLVFPLNKTYAKGTVSKERYQHPYVSVDVKDDAGNRIPDEPVEVNGNV